MHVHNPTAGLLMTWKRLDETYVAPEAVEALSEKMDGFPKICNKDNQKLQELGRLLLGLKMAVKDEHLPDLDA